MHQATSMQNTWETLDHITQDNLDAMASLHLRYIEGRLGGRRIFLRNTNLSGLSLVGRNLRQAQFMGCAMREMNLAMANFAEGSLYSCDLSDSNLHKASFVRTDLRGTRIENANLLGANLRQADLRAGGISKDDGPYSQGQVVNFSGANLTGARLVGSLAAHANFSDAILVGANIAHADLRGANMQGADLSNAEIKGTQMEGADLKSTIMTGINREALEAAHIDIETSGALTDDNIGQSILEMDMPLTKMVDNHRLWVETAGESGRQLDLSRIDMRPLRGLDREKLTALRAKETKFFGMTLTFVEMQSAMLEGSDFRNCDMTNADLRGSYLKGCNFSHTILRGMNGMPLLFGEGATTRRFSPCIFDGAVLRYADLSGTLLKNASFKGADLSYASFVGADLRDADFSGALMQDTILEGAQMDGIKQDGGGHAFHLGALKDKQDA